MVSCKRFLLLASFVLLCFVSPSAARALSLHGDGEKGMDYKFSPNQDGTAAGDDSDELVAMDYTPAKKNTPIHN
ncbi:hypothetical protein PRUPE_6G166400 [Prunus persica]|uniref:Uncharacterized protein n=1 Tax=Prunus persica TaxID=3760 RepID=A0A251NRF8_PRUPE|nr:hypothetical protein PRUPE_6G166400 [Prunus persica]